MESQSLHESQLLWGHQTPLHMDKVSLELSGEVSWELLLPSLPQARTRNLGRRSSAVLMFLWVTRFFLHSAAIFNKYVKRCGLHGMDGSFLSKDMVF